MLKSRVLVLTPRFPYPAIGGDRLHILHTCRALKQEFSLTLLSLCETRAEMEYQPDDGIFAEIHHVFLPRWRSYLNTAMALPGTRPLQLAYYRSAEYRRKVESLSGEHDLVFAQLIRTGQYIENASIPRVLDMTDAISMNYERLRKTTGKRTWKHLVYAVEQARLKRYEMRAIRNFDRVWLTSHRDWQYLDPGHEAPVDVIPNGTDLEGLAFRPPAEDGHAIVFIGNMTTLQNQDACRHFAQEILPLVRHELGNVIFRIVGNAPQAIRKMFERMDGVETTGRIERIQDGVRGAFCAVCPMRAAAGLQNKVLEYMALGLPCVTSELGLGPIEATDGKEVLVYRDPQEAARKIIELKRNRELRLAIAHSGRALVEARYDWQQIYPRFVESCSSAAGVSQTLGEVA